MGVAGSWRERFSKYVGSADELSLEEDAERKVGMLLKMIFVATAGVVAYQFFPYMGDNLLHQSVSLLQVKDPMFKRMGASRLSRFAVDDERRMKIVEIGGAKYLLNMLESAKDDCTRKEALKALVALSHSEQVARVLHQSGVLPIIRSIPNSSEYIDVENYKSKLMKRYEDLKYDTSI